MRQGIYIYIGRRARVGRNYQLPLRLLGLMMDIASKAKRSQALIDSIEELIALERDVSLATDSCCQRTAEGQPQQVTLTYSHI